MNQYIITPEQCTFIIEELKYFLCGICGNLVQKFLIHDGGFGQEYCQRPYCCSCIDSCGKVPIKANGKRDYAPIRCPVVNCEATFQQPKFRNPSLCDIELYSMVQVACKKCGVNYSNPEVYGKHLSQCCGTYKSQRQVGILVNCSLSRISAQENLRRQAHRQFISFNCSLSNKKHVYGNLRKLPNNLVLRIFFENQLYRCQIDSGMSTEELMAKLKQFLGVEDDLKVVFIKHRSLITCKSLKDFFEDVPIGSPFNLTPFRNNVSNCNNYICLYKL